MGTDYFIACEEEEELFELGRGAWGAYLPLSPVPITEEQLKKGILEHLPTLDDEGDAKLQIRRSITHAIDWCEDREWVVQVISDASEKWATYADWEVTGGLADEVTNLTVEEIRRDLERRAECIMEELGLDRVRIIGLTTDIPLLDEQPLLGWQINAVAGYDQQGSGFKRVLVDERPVKDELVEEENDRRR